MSKRVKAVLVIFLSLVAVIVLTACNDEIDTHKGEVTYEIATTADFLDIANKLGADYDKATFNLTADITLDGTNWRPIGSSVEESFRGRLNGNGHKITLSVNSNGNYMSILDSYYGIFGYIHGASFYDIEIDIDYQIMTDLDISFVGGVAGFAYGNNVFEDITLSGTVDLFPAFKTEFLPNGDERALIDKIAYIGGLVGYATGEAVVDGLYSNSFTIIAPQIESRTFYNDFYLENAFSFNNVYAGVAAGYMRTVNIAEGSKERNTLKNIEVNPDIEIFARNIYAGGIVGIIYNTDTENIVVNGDALINVPSQKHGYNGGAFGLADNSTIKNGVITIDIKLAPEDNISLNPSYGVGGAVGYATNGTVLTNITVQDITIEITLERKAQAYCGGLVGVLRNSKVTNSVSTGGFVVGDGFATSPEDFTQMAMLNARGGHFFKGLAGAIGLMHGGSLIDDIDIDFVAYQGAVAEVSFNITIIRTEDKEGNEEVESVEIEDDELFIGEGVEYNAQKTGAYGYTGSEAAYEQNNYGTGVLPTFEE